MSQVVFVPYLKVGCLHPVACTRSGSGFPSNATLVWIFYSVTASSVQHIFPPEDGHKTETCSEPWTWPSICMFGLINNQYSLLISSIPAMYLTHLILLRFIALIIFRDEQKSQITIYKTMTKKFPEFKVTRIFLLYQRVGSPSLNITVCK
jgi:hypothetical protein